MLPSLATALLTVLLGVPSPHRTDPLSQHPRTSSRRVCPDGGVHEALVWWVALLAPAPGPGKARGEEGVTMPPQKIGACSCCREGGKHGGSFDACLGPRINAPQSQTENTGRHGITFDGSTYTLRLLLSDEHACSRVNRSAMFPLILNNNVYFCAHSRHSHELSARNCWVRHGKKEVRDAIRALGFQEERVNV